MTAFAEALITAIAKRLSLQQGHGLPVAEGFRHYAEEIITDIRPIVNAEFARLSASTPAINASGTHPRDGGQSHG